VYAGDLNDQPVEDALGQVVAEQLLRLGYQAAAQPDGQQTAGRRRPHDPALQPSDG
jgi:hypothetical protein